MLFAFVFAAVTATIQPPSPKVGDLITLDFAEPVTLDASRDFEIVTRTEKRVIVRTFQPKPFVVHGTAGTVRFDDLVIPVGSVLAPDDPMTPAPLAPPVEVPYPRAPFIAIALAALVAIATWALVWWRSKRDALAPLTRPELTPERRFRDAVLALRTNSAHPRRWAALADETRAYLAATRHLGKELTTTELVPLLAEHDAIVADILHHGDFEKFAPRGTPRAEFEDVAQRALALAEAQA